MDATAQLRENTDVSVVARAEPLIVRSVACAELELMQQIEPALHDGRAVGCVVPDGGVAFIIESVLDRRERAALALTTLAGRAVARMSPTDRAAEIRAMDTDFTTSERAASAGLIFRAPDRTIGRLTRIDGIVHEIRERAGRAEMIVLTTVGAMGDRFRVIAPTLPGDDVVSGARVRVYGMHAAMRTVQFLGEDHLEAVVYAVLVVARSQP